MAGGTPPGFFGKLPSHGDFVLRRLPRGFVDPWDGWLQEGLTASRDQLGDDWLDAFLHSPVWRFALAGGTCGARAWMGVLMPSVDRVGRYFPLTIAVPLSDGDPPARTAWFADTWFGQAEAAVLAALDQDLNVERFDRQVEALGEPLAPPEAGAPAPGTAPAPSAAAPPRPLHDGPVCVTASSPDRLSMLFPDLLDALLADRYGSYSMWWTTGSDDVAPTLLTCLGMPPATGYAALLDGAYARWGWTGPALGPAEAAAPKEDAPAEARAAGADGDGVDAPAPSRTDAAEAP